MYHNNTSSLIPLTYSIDGELNPSVLQHCFKNILARHDVLRLRVTGTAQCPVATYRSVPESFPLKIVDLNGVDRKTKGKLVFGYGEREAAVTIDLSTDLPLRAMLVRLNDKRHILFLTIHHLVCDGWSVGLLIRDLYSLYHIPNHDVLPRPVQYANYIFYEKELIENGSHTKALSWWTIYLKGVKGPSLSPNKYYSENINGVCPYSFDLPINAESLRKHATALGRSEFIIGLAATFVTICSEFNTNECIVWIGIAGDRSPDYEKTIGLFTNRLPLRSKVNFDQSFSQIVMKTCNKFYEAYERRETPFPFTQQILNKENGDLNVFFQFVKPELCSHKLAIPGGLVFTLEDFRTQESEIDLYIALHEKSDGGLWGWTYHRTESFSVFQGRSFMDKYVQYLTLLIQQPNVSIRSILNLNSLTKR